MKPTYNPKRLPVMLTGRWVDIPLFTSELEAVAALAPQEKRSTSSSSSGGRTSKRGRKSIEDRAAAYVAKMEPSISGQHGHDRAYAAACALIIGFDLTIEQARPIYLAEFNSRCQPQWSESEVDHKLEDASNGDGERGYLLKDVAGHGGILPKHENEFEPLPLLEQNTLPTKASEPAAESCPFDDLPSLADDPAILSSKALGNAESAETEIIPFDVMGEPKTEISQTTQAEPSKPLIEKAPIRNFEEILVDGNVTSYALPINVIVDRIFRQTENWPRRVGTELFVENSSGSGVDWIKNQESLFAFLGSKTGFPPEFIGGKSIHTQSRGEVFERLKTASQGYNAVEQIPHEPPMEGHYYACKHPANGDGSTLAKLVDRFNPETEVDRDLILAAFVTPFWGGRPGTRPAFCITSPDGRGAGKSRVAFMVSDLAGGHVEISNGEDFQTVKTRMLSPDGAVRRIALLDNVKSLKFSWAELESLITAPTISGKKLFVGEGSRPNTLTFFITLNGRRSPQILHRDACSFRSGSRSTARRGKRIRGPSSRTIAQP